MVQRPAFDEITGGGVPGEGADGSAGDGGGRPELAALRRWLHDTPVAELGRRQQAAEATFRQLGITFAVYGDEDAGERIIPFDIVPRVFLADEWRRLSDGLVQRVEAINAFLKDIYSERRILDEGVVPADLVLGNPQFRPEIAGMRPPHDIWAHVCGIDLVRTGPDEFFVLEDNARTPSGVSYMLENREAMIRLCPELFREFRVAAVDSYPDRLLATMKSVAPHGSGSSPTCVLLTPGHYNSAYYEHSFLADSMGIELVEAADLVVDDDLVWMRTIAGRVRVDVIYRRIDDDYLDPLVFRPDSALGVPGLIAAYAAGTVAIINAPGNGIADDKAIYSYMPEIVRFYSGGEAKLPNVETWRCREPDALAYVLDHLPELVVKLVDGSGGYGMLVGPTATRAEIEVFRAALVAEPHRYIAQPTLALSTVPTLADTGLSPRHVDFRPFVLSGSRGVEVVPGGLTRVALRQGSLVVNSSQGGGTKDSFVLMDAARRAMTGTGGSGTGGEMTQAIGGGMSQAMGGMTQTLRPPGGA
ncbi:circularly permuted type 2 ATP-grasp protein [Sphingomonas bacterium]|uniref:circularly permuted type 2 ATP-grasp protein n=1 Tax=Sphingomonas bacterium TaxID=1895847 RepID=UPI001576A994|nr:circularly permuted type 2 ATP-grasp protein [Sphingomonas bacterium]